MRGRKPEVLTIHSSDLSELERIARSDTIHGVEGNRHQQIHADDERDAEAQEAIEQESLAALAAQTRPHEQAGQKEHELHQVDVLEGAEQVEADPAFAVDDRISPPAVGRTVEGGGSGGLRPDIGDEGMERHHHDDGEAAQIAERQTGFGHASRTDRHFVSEARPCKHSASVE